ncbi:MAG: transposase [Candidatus Glassbacteria bacterium]|nr:transposase [Candidatus Glassbacteria bacterium]
MKPENRNRRSIRLADYDYATPGAYLVTICTWNRECLFGEIRDGKMFLNVLGDMVSRYWQAIPGHFKNVKLDEFVVMPYHIHGLLIIEDSSGEACLAPTKGPALGAIVGAFKSSVTRVAGKTCGFTGRQLWQRNYYEHVARNEMDLDDTRRYIVDSPARWGFNS